MQPIFENEDENFTSQAEIDIPEGKAKTRNKKSSSIGGGSNSLNKLTSFEKQVSDNINGTI